RGARRVAYPVMFGSLKSVSSSTSNRCVDTVPPRITARCRRCRVRQTSCPLPVEIVSPPRDWVSHWEAEPPGGDRHRDRGGRLAARGDRDGSVADMYRAVQPPGGGEREPITRGAPGGTRSRRLVTIGGTSTPQRWCRRP